jgi:phosphoglycerate dehydrogenase-like enzyme
MNILIIDEQADFYGRELQAAFPGITVNAVHSRKEADPYIAGMDVLGAKGSVRIFDDALIRPAAKLKWIQAFTTGTDGIKKVPSLKKETLLTSMRGIHGPQMAEMAVMQMIALGRDLPRYVRQQGRGVWQKSEPRSIHRKTLVIVGIGIIGEALAIRAKPFGMTVIGVTETPRPLPGFDRMVRRPELEAVAREADYLVAVLPWSPETDKIIGARVFAAMKPTAYFINIARGGVCDEAALLAALREKRIAGAALDVFTKEPLDPEHPFWGLENVILTPHTAGDSDEYHEQAVEVMKKNLRCFLDGRVPDMVNRVPLA